MVHLCINDQIEIIPFLLKMVSIWFCQWDLLLCFYKCCALVFLVPRAFTWRQIRSLGVKILSLGVWFTFGRCSWHSLQTLHILTSSLLVKLTGEQFFTGSHLLANILSYFLLGLVIFLVFNVLLALNTPWPLSFPMALFTVTSSGNDLTKGEKTRGAKSNLIFDF